MAKIHFPDGPLSQLGLLSSSSLFSFFELTSLAFSTMSCALRIDARDGGGESDIYIVNYRYIRQTRKGTSGNEDFYSMRHILDVLMVISKTIQAPL